MNPTSTYPRCSSNSTSALPSTMLARLVQRWSLVEGGSLPGSMKAPITPPSNRMVRPGQRRRCASVAASSGMPTPANTTCPSPSWRALRIVSSSAAVWLCGLGIVDALSGASRLKQLVHPDQGEKLAPRFRPIDIAIEVFGHAPDRFLVHQPDVVFHMADHRLVDAVAFVRCASERKLDYGIHRKKRNLGLIGCAPDLIVRDNAFGRQDHLVGGDRQVRVH